MKRYSSIIILTLCILLMFSPAAAYAADYTVQTSDSLYKIGQLFQVPVSTLKLDNHLSTDMIYPGQVLYVPSQIYTIKSGDTLYLIAKRNGLSLTALRKANAKWDNLIIPGQTLILPGVNTKESTKTDSNKTVIQYTDQEVDLLARLIEAEASGETYQAKVGVGGVVVNRVQSSDWPSDITDVIYQVINGYYQFTPVKNGMINKPASDDAIRAAWAVLYGSDPSNGAIFYFDDSSTNSWMWSRTQTAYIDHMVFVK